LQAPVGHIETYSFKKPQLSTIRVWAGKLCFNATFARTSLRQNKSLNLTANQFADLINASYAAG
jgi:hypothetical protein